MLKCKAVEEPISIEDHPENDVRLSSGSIQPDDTEKVEPGLLCASKKRRISAVELKDENQQDIPDSTSSVDQVTTNVNQKSCHLSGNSGKIRNSESVEPSESTDFTDPQNEASSTSHKDKLPTEEDSDVLQCHSCKKSFNRSDSSHHSKHLHASVQYTCNDCEKSSELESNTEQQDSIQSKSKKNRCNICLKTFKIPSRLIFHMRSHRKPYRCDVCGMAFKGARELKEHLSSHFTKKPLE